MAKNLKARVNEARITIKTPEKALLGSYDYSFAIAFMAEQGRKKNGAAYGIRNRGHGGHIVKTGSYET